MINYNCPKDKEDKNMKTLLFKKSLLDTECIKIKVFRWHPTKDGIIAKTINGWETISTRDIYFWGVE